MRSTIESFIHALLDSFDSSRHFDEALDFRSFLGATKQRGGTVFFLGNGASASISSTLAFKALAEQGIKAVALTDHNLLLGMARKKEFSGWMSGTAETLIGPNDALVLTSSSGESENIVNLAKFAQQRGLPTFSLTGFCSDNLLRSVCDAGIWVNSKNYNVVETAHLLLGLLGVRYIDSAIDEANDFRWFMTELETFQWSSIVDQLMPLTENLSSMDFDQHRVIFVGDGSSASLASHLATDFSKSGLIAQALNDHNFLSASQNDFGSTEWIAVGINRSYRPGDLIIMITHSNLWPAEIFALKRLAAQQKRISLHGTVPPTHQYSAENMLIYPVIHPVNELVAPSIGLLGIAEAFLATRSRDESDFKAAVRP